MMAPCVFSVNYPARFAAAMELVEKKKNLPHNKLEFYEEAKPKPYPICVSHIRALFFMAD